MQDAAFWTKVAFDSWIIKLLIFGVILVLFNKRSKAYHPDTLKNFNLGIGVAVVVFLGLFVQSYRNVKQDQINNTFFNQPQKNVF